MHAATFVLLVFTWLAHATTTSLDGILSLVQRQVPDHADAFTFTLVQGEADSFMLSDTVNGSGINVQCSSVSACARGLYTYVQ